MKNFLIICTILYILVSLTACLNYTQVTTIKTDNSGKMYIHYWTHMNPDLDSLLQTKLGLFNKDSLTTIFKQNYTELNFARVFHNFGDSSLHAQIEFEFSNFDSLNQLQFFRHSELSVKEGPNDTKIFSQFIQPITSSFGLSKREIDITYVYYLPGEILNHNANSHSRNKLVWDFNLDNIGTGKTITANYVPFKLKETPLWIYLIAGVVIFIVLVFLFKKSKK